MSEEEKRLEVIVPLHVGPKIAGGIRVVSSLDEAQSYLSKKRDRTIITDSFEHPDHPGDPHPPLSETGRKSHPEIGGCHGTGREGGSRCRGPHSKPGRAWRNWGRNFNQMLRTIREAHEQNVHLLSQVNQFNEELTRKIEAATSELARRNEELRLLNEALFESQRQVGQSEKLAALGQVTATMAHQMGTPLNSISGYIQLMLREGNLQPKERGTAQDHRIATRPFGGIRQEPPLLHPSAQTPVKTAWE